MLTRRGFLARAAAGVVLVGAGQVLLTAPNAAAAPVVPGYGPLRDDPDGLLALPAGFSYRLVTAAGRTRLESGEPTPGFHDGTGAFARRGGGTLLVVNHEIREPLADAEHPVPPLDGLTYDPAMAGGATIVETDAQGARLREVVGLAGTSTNCAGGITPWRTWLSCEETETREGEGVRSTTTATSSRSTPTRRPPTATPSRSERWAGSRTRPPPSTPPRARSTSPRTPPVPNGLLYRWSPPAGFRPGRGALLRGSARPTGCSPRCAARTARAGRSTISRAPPRSARATPSSGSRWTTGAARKQPTRTQLGDGDVTRARKLEGAWWGSDAGRGAGAYVVSSFARDESPVPHDGQVWFLDPKAGTLTLGCASAAAEDDVDGPDNISVSPWGGLVIAEDGEGSQHLVGATADGRTYPIARADGGEFTGPVYSADGGACVDSRTSRWPGARVQYADHRGPWRRGTG